MKCLTARRSDACPRKIIRPKHSSFIERTKRSAKAFRLGDRGGRRMILMPSRTRRLRKASEYLVSLSRMRYRLPRRNPSSISVRLRAACIIHGVIGVRGGSSDVHGPGRDVDEE